MLAIGRHAKRGDIDTQEWAREFPDREALTIAGRSVYVLHDLGDVAARNIDVVVVYKADRLTRALADFAPSSRFSTRRASRSSR
jgi:hypothetical protein